MLPFPKKGPDKADAARAFAWHVNFRNATELPDTRTVRTSFFVNLVSVVVAAGLLIGVIYQETRLSALRHDISEWQQRIDTQKPKSEKAIALYKTFKVQEEKVNQLDAYLKLDKLVFSDFIIRLGETLPPGIVLTRVDFRDGGITLRGDIRGVPELASGLASAYEKQLREDKAISSPFESVALTTLSPDDKAGRLTFVIAMKPPAPPKK